MVIYLPAQSVEEGPVLDELTPREIVRELDKYVIGQPDAKRAVAIALRNRLRRQKLPPEMADDLETVNGERIIKRAGIWPYVVLVLGIAVVAITHRLAVY